MHDPWSASGRWLRCALHAHTTGSDGELAPRRLAAHYERAGYDVLAITDHWVRTEAPSSERLLVIPGAELNTVLPAGRDGHLLAIGIEGELAELEGERLELGRAAEWVAGCGGVAYLAHPYWTGVAAGSLELPAAVSGIEVFNAGCELEVGRGLSSVHWDELLEAGRACFALATDDTHHPGFDSDFAWTWVRAEERTAGAVLAALRSGCFYASEGPLIETVRVDPGSVEVRCSPCRSVTLLAGSRSGTAVHAGRLGYRHGAEVLEVGADGLVTAARLDLPESAPFARLELVDARGRRAWSNPVWPR